MKQQQALLQEFLSKLEDTVGTKEFAMWFSVIGFSSVSDTHVEISVPAEFFKNELEKKWQQILLDTIKCVFPSNESMAIVVASQTNASTLLKKSPPVLEAVSHQRATIPEKKSIRSSTSSLLHLNIQPEFLFENFVIGPSNEFAASIAIAIANNPAKGYNPCFIYGNVGLGKTHLLQAIANRIQQNDPDSRILYTTTEVIINDCYEKLITQNKTTNSRSLNKFKQQFRSTDVLLLDDIQFFEGKPVLMEEFFHIFELLKNDYKQMVFTCDRPINVLNVEPRLTSRFQSGMAVDLQSPDTDTAKAILLSSLKRNKKEQVVPDDILDYICKHLRSNIRNMLAFLNRVIGFGEITKNQVTIELVQEWMINFHQSSENKKDLIDTILKTTANYFDIGVSDIKNSKRRIQPVSIARSIAIYLLEDIADLSRSEIARQLNLSHVSCGKSIVKIEESISICSDINKDITAIKLRLKC